MNAPDQRSRFQELTNQLGEWRVVEPTAAVRVSRLVQRVFDDGLYRIGIRGATTVAKAACRVLSNDAAVVVNGVGARFSFPAWDSYYGPFFYRGLHYEPEITRLLAAHAANPSAALLDCGANYGYWSVLARQVLGGSIVAVELNAHTYSWLLTNAEGVERPIDTLHAAIWDVDGIEMTVLNHGPNQADSAEVAAATQPGSSAVRSRSIDSIVSEFRLPAKDLLVKVDCEGAEVRALAGAADTAAQHACFVLEDHGMDRDCLVSRRLFELDFRVATFTDGRWQETFTLAAVQAMKTDPDHGYNVLAWRGDLQPALLAAF